MLAILLGLASPAVAIAIFLLDRRRKSNSADLQLVSAEIGRDESGQGFPFMELLVRAGDSVHVVRELRLWDVIEWQFARKARFRMLPVSWTYDIDLDQPDRSYALRQEVPRHGSDCFRIRIGRTAIPAIYGAVLYEFHATLVVDRKSDLELGRFLVKVPIPLNPLGVRFAPEWPEKEALKAAAADLLNRVDDFDVVDDAAIATLQAITIPQDE